MRSLEWLLGGQRALRERFDDLARALRRNDPTALDVALRDFEYHLRRWTEAEEKSVIPAVTRAGIEGRDPRRELRLEYVQVRELTNFLLRSREQRVALGELLGYLDNLERRLAAHERGNASVYYPIAAGSMNEEEWGRLEAVRPD